MPETGPRASQSGGTRPPLLVILPIACHANLRLDFPDGLVEVGNARSLAYGIYWRGAERGSVRADTNVRRVLGDVTDPKSAIDALTAAEARAFACSDECHCGMKPKLPAAARAVTAGAAASYICAGAPGAIRSALFAADATIIS